MENKKRNFAIDILKFFAVLLITNSHFDEQYVYFKDLAFPGYCLIILLIFSEFPFNISSYGNPTSSNI